MVDNHYAAIGGLDLCFGRWDTHTHPLADVHPTDFSKTIFPGQDYNNARIMDFQDVYDYASNQLSILQSARMPWHDVGLLNYVPTSLSMLRVTHEYHVGSYDLHRTSCPGCLSTFRGTVERNQEAEGQLDLDVFCCSILSDRVYPCFSIAMKSKLTNHLACALLSLILFIYSSCRKWPWLALPLTSEDTPDEAIPRMELNFLFRSSTHSSALEHPHLRRWGAIGHKYKQRWHGHNKNEPGYAITKNGTCNVQVVRSVSDWSHGVLTEASIQNACRSLSQ